MSLVADEATANGIPPAVPSEDHSGARFGSDRYEGLTFDKSSARDAWLLVELAQGGDLDAFGSLYCAYRDEIFHYLLRRLGNRVNAEDLVSETFIRAFNSISSFTYTGKNFGAWVMTIARNLTIDFYKSSYQQREVSTSIVFETGSAEKSAEECALEHVAADALRECLGQLPRRQQTCLVMRFLLGLPVAETAARMGRSAPAVRQLQLRAIRQLAHLIDGSERY